MTDIGDKVLGALVAHLHADMDHAKRDGHTKAALQINGFINAITALRARVKEVEQHEKNCAELLFERGRLLKHARQVTREQLNNVFQENAKHWFVRKPTMSRLEFEAAIKSLNLEIVEDAPKAEGRQCDCPEWEGSGPVCYQCKRLGVFLMTRCTITEGERDETR